MKYTEFDPVLMPKIRRLADNTLEDMAKQLAEVQPMNVDVSALFKAGKTEAQLIAEGYTPVCPFTRLMWIKKPDNENT